MSGMSEWSFHLGNTCKGFSFIFQGCRYNFKGEERTVFHYKIDKNQPKTTVDGMMYNLRIIKDPKDITSYSYSSQV